MARMECEECGRDLKTRPGSVAVDEERFTKECRVDEIKLFCRECLNRPPLKGYHHLFPLDDFREHYFNEIEDIFDRRFRDGTKDGTRWSDKAKAQMIRLGRALFLGSGTEEVVEYRPSDFDEDLFVVFRCYNPACDLNNYKIAEDVCDKDVFEQFKGRGCKKFPVTDRNKTAYEVVGETGEMRGKMNCPACRRSIIEPGDVHVLNPKDPRTEKFPDHPREWAPYYEVHEEFENATDDEAEGDR